MNIKNFKKFSMVLSGEKRPTPEGESSFLRTILRSHNISSPPSPTPSLPPYFL